MRRLFEVVWAIAERCVEQPPPPHLFDARPCLIYQGAQRGRVELGAGYGAVKYRGKARLVHRVVYRAIHRKWPKPEALHLCDRRMCCEPSHLVQGSHSLNMRQMFERGRAGGFVARLETERWASAVADIEADRRAAI